MKSFLFLLIFLPIQAFGASVLVIGDSHTTGPFGKKLDELIRANHTVVTRGACGTIGKNWQNGTSGGCGEWNWGKGVDGKDIISTVTPKLDQLVDEMKPDYVILQFGGNYRKMLENEDTKEKAKFLIPNDVVALIKTAKSQGAKCLFVTGPDTYEGRNLLPETIDLVQQGVGEECTFFNSLEVTEYPDQYVGKKRPNGKKYTDGKHYSFDEGQPIAHEWAEKVFQAFTEIESANSLSSISNQLNSGE